MKRILCIFAALLLALAMCTPALADHYTGDPDWHVTFTADKQMVSTFSDASLSEAVSGLQPGDDIIFSVKLKTEYSEPVNWYMQNNVLYSLEDRSANSATGGGAYTYRLSYIDPDGAEQVLFSSDTIGGEGESPAGIGLHEATNALGEFFYLDNLTTNQAGEILLTVSLDGETQGNDYQDTLADLQMAFAVDIETINTPYDPEDPEDPYNPENPDSPYNPSNPDSPYNPSNPDSPYYNPDPPYVVYTGDNYRLLPYYIAMAGAGVLFLVLGFISLRRQRKEKKVGTDA